MLGDEANPYQLMELPGCLRKMLDEVVIPNAKQDVSSLFREEVRDNAEVQSVFEEYREKLTCAPPPQPAMSRSLRRRLCPSRSLRRRLCPSRRSLRRKLCSCRSRRPASCRRRV